MRFIKYAVIISLIALQTACGGPFTRLAKSDYANTNQGYSVNLPVGWVQATGPQSGDQLLISKDGYSLQSIQIQALKHDKAFEKTKKVSNTSMPLSDLAEQEIAELNATNPNAASIKILENSLINIDNKKAFKLHYQYLNDRGLRFEQITYGLINAQFYYKLSYVAPTLHYFLRDKATFEQTVNSFKLKS